MAESDFQSRYLLAAFEVPTNAMDLPKFSQHTLDKAIHECRKAIDNLAPHSSEQLVYLQLLIYLWFDDNQLLIVFDVHAGKVAGLCGTI